MRPTRNAGLRRRAPVSDRARDCADEGADPDRGVQVANPAVSEVEQLDRMTTMKTWSAPNIAVCAVSSAIITRSDGSRPRCA